MRCVDRSLARLAAAGQRCFRSTLERLRPQTARQRTYDLGISIPRQHRYQTRTLERRRPALRELATSTRSNAGTRSIAVDSHCVHAVSKAISRNRTDASVLAAHTIADFAGSRPRVDPWTEETYVTRPASLQRVSSTSYMASRSLRRMTRGPRRYDRITEGEGERARNERQRLESAAIRRFLAKRLNSDTSRLSCSRALSL